MKCPKCGYEMKDSLQCPLCGHKIVSLSYRRYLRYLPKSVRCILALVLIFSFCFPKIQSFLNNMEEKKKQEGYTSEFIIEDPIVESSYSFNQVGRGRIFNVEEGIYYSTTKTYFYSYQTAQSKIVYGKPVDFLYFYHNQLFGLVDGQYMYLSDKEVLFDETSKVYQSRADCYYLDSHGVQYYNVETHDSHYICLDAIDFVIEDKSHDILCDVGGQTQLYHPNGMLSTERIKLTNLNSYHMYSIGDILYCHDDQGIYEYDKYNNHFNPVGKINCDEFYQINAYNTTIYIKDGLLYIQNDEETKEIGKANHLYSLNDILVYEVDGQFYSIDRTGKTEKLFY